MVSFDCMAGEEDERYSSGLSEGRLPFFDLEAMAREGLLMC